MKQLFVLSFFISLSFHLSAQTEATAEQKESILKDMGYDSVALFHETAENICKCIDSIEWKGKDGSEVSKEIKSCIDEQVGAYQITLSVMKQLKDNITEIKVLIDTNKRSAEYITDYRTFESWLRDSCNALTTVLATNDKKSETSMSKNEEALKEYHLGATLLSTEKYKEAIPYFEKAVKIDPVFAFAWDNLGICYRRTDDFKKAIKAYNKSLEIDAKGVTPLHNLPIAYEYLKEYDKAIAAYKNIEKVYPGDPETYFGCGRVYVLKNEWEEGLDQLCKAYNIYTKSNSPYRVDAEKLINAVNGELKKQHKTDVFDRVLKANNISQGEK